MSLRTVEAQVFSDQTINFTIHILETALIITKAIVLSPSLNNPVGTF
jgi:hypothetical protein